MTGSPIPHKDPDVHNIADNDKLHLARRYHTLLTHRVQAFKNKIGEGHEVGLRLVNLGGNEVFYLDEIHHADPALLAFCGETLDGQPFEIIQDVTAVNLLLQALPKRAKR